MSDANSKPSIDSALRNLNYGFIEEQAIIAQSLWKSIEEAAFRGEPMAVGVHLKQIRLLTDAVVNTLEEALRICAKDAARSEAIRRWPDKAALFARVRDDGRAEAALIGVAGLMREARR